MNSRITPIIVAAIGAILLAASFVFKGNASGDDINVVIEKADFIMPAAHRVYANPQALDGKYYLFKAKIKNNTNHSLEDVRVRYRIPGYIDWTELTVSGQMFPGQTLVVPCYPKFDDKITEKSTESIEKAEVEVSWDGASKDDIVEEEFSFKFTNRNEYVYTGIKKEEISTWSDMFDNNALIACFVTPNDPIVKYYTQNLQEKLLKGEAASVTNKPEDGVRFLAGIYEGTRASHMVYSGTKGIPQSTEDVQSIVQQIRLPREVITGNTGLCIELSCLYASVLSAAGIDPIIYMVPGHAYPGFKMNGQYYAIEATGINGEGLGGIMGAEEAFKKGQEQLETFFKQAQMGDPRYTLVDIHAVNQQGVTSMDLKDDQFLRGKVDQIVASWSGGAPVQDNNKPSNQGGSNRVYTPDNNLRTSSLSFSIPSGWQTHMKPVPQMPILTAQVTSPDQLTTVSIYDIPAGNVQQALNTIEQYFGNFGMSMQYQINGNTVVGLTYSNAGTFNWMGKALNKSGGIRLVAVGSPDYAFGQKSNEINTIYNSIR
ncbi:MAG TPA: hypothetical protein PKL92_04280 [Aquaticitalea sp.]|nr:hypothetical protein [Aquaticitalea sp.]HNU58619.1 hypothetical protein [Aquaticitalea sp.]